MNTVDGGSMQSLLDEMGVKLPSFTAVNVVNNLMDIFSAYLADFLVQQTNCPRETALRCLQWPNEIGDVVAVLPRLRLEGVDVSLLAEELAEKFPESPLFAQPFADDFNLRFMFMEESLGRLLVPFILDRGIAYGLKGSNVEAEANPCSQRKVVVEFSSPNLGREFDGNHLRSTVIGAFLAALYAAMGWQVIRMNFLGDWGKHIGHLAVGWARFGVIDDLKSSPLHHLLEIASNVELLRLTEQPAADGSAGPISPSMREHIDNERDAFFKDLEDGSIEALVTWKRFRDASITEYRELYSRLNVFFDTYSGESEVSIDSIAEVEQALMAAKVYDLSKGAWIVRFPKEKYAGLGVGIARFKNGTTSYLLRDVAAVLDRNKKFGYDKMLYVVSAKQASHFRQVFACLELMGCDELVQKIEHVSFGPLNGLNTADGADNMLLGSILDRERINDSHHLESANAQPSPTDVVGWNLDSRVEVPEAAGLVSQILSGKRASAVSCEPRSRSSTRGRTGIALYACMARLDRVIGRVINTDPGMLRYDVGQYTLVQEEYTEILRHLIHFPDVVHWAYKSMESSGLVVYLFRLAELVDLVINQTNEPIAVEPAEVAFFKASRQVLVNGMTLLGLRIDINTIGKTEDQGTYEK